MDSRKFGIKYDCKWRKGFRFEVDEGLHAYTDLRTAYKYKEKDEKIVKLYIPEGAFYIKGENNNVVTNILITKDLHHVSVKPRKKPIL